MREAPSTDRHCPDCRTQMGTVVECGVSYDNCVHCGVTVVRDCELGTLRKWDYDRGYRDGLATERKPAATVRAA